MSQSMLDSKRILATVEKLKLRIGERFPDSGLGRVCGELEDVGQETDATLEHIRRPNYCYRGIVFCFVSVLLAIAFWGLSVVCEDYRNITWIEMVQVLDAAFNVILLIGGAVLFLVSIENRAKRQKVIQAVNRLRSLAHIIDSHQLTKDPCYMNKGVIRTPHSPERNLDSFQLSRYLNYCSEMLSMISKIGFLYVQYYHDPVAMEAVNDLDDLTNGLSRKIWQKIMTIDKTEEKPAIKY